MIESVTWNVIQLSLAFFFIFSAFDSTASIQKIVIDKVKGDDPSFRDAAFWRFDTLKI
jgi:hypothetical protein